MPAISGMFTDPAGWDRGEAWKRIYAPSGGHEMFLGQMGADPNMFFRDDTTSQSVVNPNDNYGALLLAYFNTPSSQDDVATATLCIIHEKDSGDTFPSDARVPGFTFAYDSDQSGSLSDTVISDGAGESGWTVVAFGEGSAAPATGPNTGAPWTRRTASGLFVNKSVFPSTIPQSGYTRDGFGVTTNEYNIRGVSHSQWTGDLGIVAWSWAGSTQSLSASLTSMRSQLRTLAGV